jgi:hypothetical protein
MVLVHSVFHTRKNFPENYPQFGHVPSKIFASPVLCRRISKNIGLKGARLLVCLVVPMCFGPALSICIYVHERVYARRCGRGLAIGLPLALIVLITAITYPLIYQVVVLL